MTSRAERGTTHTDEWNEDLGGIVIVSEMKHTVTSLLPISVMNLKMISVNVRTKFLPSYLKRILHLLSF